MLENLPHDIKITLLEHSVGHYILRYLITTGSTLIGI